MNKGWAIVSEAVPYGLHNLTHYCRAKLTGISIVETLETKSGEIVITRENFSEVLERIKAGTSIADLATAQRQKFDGRREELDLKRF